MKNIFIIILAILTFTGLVSKAQQPGCTNPVNMVLDPDFSLNNNSFTTQFTLGQNCNTGAYWAMSFS